ncbi:MULTISPECIES: helix-turn-helix transcriptional regulator [unclassified Pseudomonas]|uniref:helix-turn-helix transcriptional regulator n=1 Tax=unclassified Pseudomonas TaxID=196821 RepID=UPI0024477DAE|nr:MULTISPECIES: helix-turn-helix transcriptional regulator [unclassified Pseudomonas]MDH0301958.1 helix-turn-helix transcriptional regulator [Pseudomonas sp. GD04091]MDH1985709.1 helix-turn-helix transcriptional regulator [Pseudomonas sp. GD03689]
MGGASHDLGRFCLQAFSQQVPASLAAFYRVDAGQQACDFLLQDLQAPMHARYLSHYRAFDPLQPGRCLAIGRPVVSLRQGLARLPEAQGHAYRRFLAQHQVVDVVEIIAQADGRPLAGVSLLRCANLGEFRSDELERLLPLHGLMQLAVARQPAMGKPTSVALTPRERQITELLRQGSSNKLIARALGVGLPTVKTHLINLFRKVGVSNRTELVASLYL